MTKTKFLPTIAALAVIGMTPAFAQTAAEAEAPATPKATTVTAAVTLTLESSSDIERTVAGYQCESGEALTVQYINAAPNFLAIVPVDGQNLIFTSAISASGARYTSGPYEWWSHQGEGTLRDLMQDEDAAPLATCTEVGETP